MYEEYVFDASVKVYERTNVTGNELQQQLNMIERTRGYPFGWRSTALLKAVH